MKEGDLEALKILIVGVASDEEKQELINSRGLQKWENNLCAAASGGYLPVVQWLVESGASVDGNSSNRPVFCAASRGHLTTVQYLMEQGAKISMILHEAAAYGDGFPVLEYLVKEGWELEELDDMGQTALHQAAESGLVGCIECLVKGGANIEATNVRGLTPLHVSAFQGHLAAVRSLVERGARKDSKTKRGRTPFDLARAKGRMDVVEFLNNPQVSHPRPSSLGNIDSGEIKFVVLSTDGCGVFAGAK